MSKCLLVEVDGKQKTLDRVREVIVLQDIDAARTVRVGDVASVA